MGSRMGKHRNRFDAPADWEHLAEGELLQVRIRDLALDIQQSPLQDNIERLYRELASHRLGFRPTCYLADEWCCPDKLPIIGVPFCLAHPRLKHIEQKMMMEVEGGTVGACMQLLRHECGHAINYAYRLYRRTRWRELFGPFSLPYGQTYTFRPYSRRYVLHLEGNYAQSHPDEDFAETFAVWLTPGSDWQVRYADWPVLSKLQYVDQLMARVAAQPPTVTTRETPWAAGRMTSTLAGHYERKRRVQGEEFPGYYDACLTRLFAVRPADAPDMKAVHFLRRRSRYITDTVASWTGCRKFDVHELLAKLMRRCEALNLYVAGSEMDAVGEITAFVTAVMGKIPGVTRGSRGR
jgi:hypothetical protein